jgi:hypothetical protein
MLIQGCGCGSIEATSKPPIGQPGLIHAIGTLGFVTMRVEKSGVGDSAGAPCGSIGYQQELAGHRAALRALKTHPAVDANRVFLLGISLGCVLLQSLEQRIVLLALSFSGRLGDLRRHIPDEATDSLRSSQKSTFSPLGGPSMRPSLYSTESTTTLQKKPTTLLLRQSSTALIPRWPST